MGGQSRHGFTIIEVVLFIAISGFLIVGLMVGTSATIARQRYDDSVQDLAEFFRREYSSVVNPQNGRVEPIDAAICDGSAVGSTQNASGPIRGRSGCLLYGRLITIGEDQSDSANAIWSYDVIGAELTDDPEATIQTSLANAKIGALVCSNQQATLIGQYKYSPQWLARAENTNVPDATNTNATRLRASILIVRSPNNGAIHTLVLNGRAISVQSVIGSYCNNSNTLTIDHLSEFKRDDDFDICVGSEDIFMFSGRRRNIRITKDGHNSSAVQIMEQDTTWDRKNYPRGNKCR